MMLTVFSLVNKLAALQRRGAIAQLGERNTGSVEVSGSIPLSSTNYSKNQRLCIVQP